MEKTEKKKKILINVAFYAVIVCIVLGMCKFILPVLIPFIIAFLLAAVVQIPAGRICRQHMKMKKAVSIFLCLCIYLLLLLIIVLVGLQMIRGTGNLILDAPGIYMNRIVPVLNEISDKLEQAIVAYSPEVATKIEEVFQNFTNDIGNYISEWSVKIVKMISGGAANIPGLVVKLVITIVATFFITADYDGIILYFKKIIPPKREKALKNIKDYVKNVLGIYVKSYALLFSLTFVELCIGFFIFRLKYAVLLALVISVFDILPVLGTGGVLIPWSIILFALGNKGLGAGILILYIIITVIRNTLEPKIVGKQIGLHPVATLIAMFLGLKLLGVIGLILFPVSLALFVNLQKNGVINIFETQHN